ncbi:MAG: 2-oxoacid:ferredoxin oxidoreductase subunit beta [Alphaproteobacteria bacterium]|nr:2-oxoacid:ferredoxin oxidoreductase subunit beta [Alphaproteobacteria bacterium]
MTVIQAPEKLTAKDLTSDQEVRWCPGCGDYAIIKGVRNALAEIGTAPQNTVFVSGIGCAARFPYYMATYGFHTIHGRAPAIATGLKLTKPELDVWVVTGDGDCLSIGGNHTLHVLRRNVDVNVLLFNNEIYGLTKGQYSPTSKIGTRSPSTPMGSVDTPVSATEFALGSGARFVARSVDTLQKHLPVVMKRAHAHKGASFVEIFQNCIVYNDGAFGHFTDRSIAADAQVHLEHGKPVVFGAEADKGIRLNAKTLKLEVVKIGENGVTEADLLVHDETNKTLATLLAHMQPPAFPVALGVLYCEPGPEYTAAVYEQVEAVKSKKPAVPMAELLHSGHTWQVGG